MLSVGQQVEAKIVDYNGDDKKISLSIKALEMDRETAPADEDVADVDIEAVGAALEAE